MNSKNAGRHRHQAAGSGTMASAEVNLLAFQMRKSPPLTVSIGIKVAATITVARS